MAPLKRTTQNDPSYGPGNEKMDYRQDCPRLNGALKRAVQEYRYFVSKNWSLKEVGKFWDSVTDYDDINENAYSYYRRFTNSWGLCKDLVKDRDNMIMLDIQSRTGKSTDFWFRKGLIKKSYLVDFSDFLLGIAGKRLEKTNFDYELVKIIDYTLPFDDDFFDFITTYETVEHIGDVNFYMREMSRVLKPNGIMVLTCPNILWEPVHWLAAILNIHHSEGPHNFLRRKKLFKSFSNNNLKVLKENSTVILPFNNRMLININEKMEKLLATKILRVITLRRSFILQKL